MLDNEAKLKAESYRDPHPPAASAAGTPSPALRERVTARAQPLSRIAGEGAERSEAGEGASSATTRARAYLQVQQGCDHRCTFCIIPYARGPSRSVPRGTIVDQARLLVAEGVREIVLTGVDLTAYGADLPGAPSLGQMVRHLLASVPELARLRLSSLDPSEIDEALWALFGDGTAPDAAPAFFAAGGRRPDLEADEAAAQPHPSDRGRRAGPGACAPKSRSAPI